MIKVLFFAKYREQFGLSQLDLASESLKSVADVICSLKQSYGGKVSFISDKSLFISVNQEIAAAETSIKDGDEIAFFPPVTGG